MRRRLFDASSALSARAIHPSAAATSPCTDTHSNASHKPSAPKQSYVLIEPLG